MRNTDELIKQLKQLIVNLQNKIQVAKVTSVDKTNATISAIADDTEYTDIRLKATIDKKNNGLVLLPVVGSYVLITNVGDSNTDTVILVYTEVEEVLITGSVSINGGDNGGVVRVADLNDNLKALNDSINTLTNAIRVGFTALSPLDGSASLNAFNTANVGNIVVFKDMENTKVKH